MKKNVKWLNWEFLLAWMVFLLFSVHIVMNAHRQIKNLTLWKDYGPFGISEWLINYEGGFVRRGLVGQILLSIEKIHLYDVRVAIILILIVASIMMMVVMYRMFKKEGWSPLILPTGMCFGFTLFAIEARRDFLSLMLTALIFYVFRQLISHPRRWGCWCIFYILSIFQILMQEASFFYTFPILMLILFQQFYRHYVGFVKSAVRSAILFLPILLAMVAVCLNRGDRYIAEAIWESWGEVFAAYPSGQEQVAMGEGPQALAWNTKDAFLMHLRYAYFGRENCAYWRALLIPLFFCSAYYLLTRINSVDMRLYRVKTMNHILMSDIAIVQFMAMLPMFTVLSCDWGRTLPYTVVSSLFFYHIFKDEHFYFPSYISNSSSRIQHRITDSSILRSPYTYIALVIVTPFPFWAAPFDFVNTLQQFIYQGFSPYVNQILTFLQ